MKKIFFSTLLLVLACMASRPAQAYNPLDDNNRRTNISFLMGWDGLGEAPLGGMRTMDNSFSTMPWFNSWQIELTYNIIVKEHWKAFVGLGYESDVFLFDYPYVYLEEHTGHLPTLQAITYFDEDDNGNPCLDGVWETRLVTRYVNIPIGFQYSFDKEFGCGITLIPGLNYTSPNTGIKYQYDGFDQNHLSTDMSSYIESFKCDIRLNFSYSMFSFFVQIPTMPLFKSMDHDIYPLKLGFMFKF